MPAGLGGGGYLALTLETVMGTYLPPTTAGTVFIPILSETLDYKEDGYYSPAIKQQTIENTREQTYYHVEGDIQIEFDSNFVPYFLHLARHNIAKSGAGPWIYTYTPSSAGSATTAASGNVERTASLTVIRNGIGFGYGGCAVNTINFTLDNGILKMTFGIQGLSEVQPGGLGTPSWAAPSLMGAAAHSIYLDTAGTAPAFAAADLTFNGFTADINYNAVAQNRIIASRSAAYISFGQTEATFNTELDFLSRTEYDNTKNNTRKAIKFESLKGGATFALSTEAFQYTLFNAAYDTYDISLPAMGDLIMAAVTGRALAIAGGNPYSIAVKSPISIT